MDEIIEKIENAREDADYWAKQGKTDGSQHVTIRLTRTECDEIAAFLTKAFGAVVTGTRDDDVSTNLACLGGAFEGEGISGSDEDEGEA